MMVLMPAAVRVGITPSCAAEVVTQERLGIRAQGGSGVRIFLHEAHQLRMCREVAGIIDQIRIAHQILSNLGVRGSEVVEVAVFKHHLLVVGPELSRCRQHRNHQQRE